ncbi:MAG: histone acetyltransferase, partial [Ruminiclostridium sp.]|nr:histone acetyltransferase [Ruminiclostridium sp.]
LHASEGVENAMTGGVYHPALGEIVKSRIMLRKILEKVERLGGKRFVIYTDKRNMSLVAGHKGANRKVLEDKGIWFKIKVREGVEVEVEKA